MLTLGSWRWSATARAPRREWRLNASCRRLERDGIQISVLARCSAEGEDGTRLKGFVKAYVPISDAPPSERPYGFVFVPTREGVLALVAFGERHPAPGTRSVYERAHKRLHGRYPNQ